MRGASLPTEGPGTSARMIYMAFPSEICVSISKNTSTPMPPIQWVNARQKSMLFGKVSTVLSMVAPVVVKPETVSKIQSIMLGIEPLM